MKIPLTKKLNLPNVINAASLLSIKGHLAKTQNNLIYLNIDDDYIHKLFPLLQDQDILMPDYFGKESVGAHITVIYPEEGVKIDDIDLNTLHRFTIKELVAAEIGQKTYYVLLIESLSLLRLRKKYGLSDLLSFKGYSIGFHITIGVKI